VTTLEFAKKSNEILLSAYSPEFGLKDSNDPNGLMVLHNIVKKKPELVIKHQTEFTSACFHQANPKYIIAGTFTGQILVYDIRVGSSPVLKSPSSLGKQHSLPIYSISNYGPENSNQVLSISNDGVVCIFNISNFSKAIKRIELKKGIESKTSGIAMEEIGVICAANNPESDYVYVGSDDSDLYQVYLGQA
jgi:dynein intermediate chain, cytosolic